MLVQIDVKKLLTQLENYNPNADLTGVKAYLFDLVLGDTPITKRARSKKVKEEELEHTFSHEDDTETSESFPEDDLLQKVMGTPAPITKNGPPKKVAINSKEAREARRKRAEEYTSMTSKEILDSLVNKNMEKNRGEHNQFINEGGNVPYDDGDLEIG